MWRANLMAEPALPFICYMANQGLTSKMSFLQGLTRQPTVQSSKPCTKADKVASSVVHLQCSILSPVPCQGSHSGQAEADVLASQAQF